MSTADPTAEGSGAHLVEAVAAAHRGGLLGVAYRLLGSVAEAEGAVQEALLRSRLGPVRRP